MRKRIFELGANSIEDNPELEPDPIPPEGFVDNTVYRYKLLPDGTKEMIGTMEGYPEGWDLRNVSWSGNRRKEGGKKHDKCRI